MQEINEQIFIFLHNFSQDRIWEVFFWILADFPIFFLPIFLSGLWLYYTYIEKSKKNKMRLLHIFYACLLGIIGSYIIKMFVDIERPEEYLQQTGDLLLSKIPEKSFPSDHATVSFAFLTALFFTHYKKVWYIFLPLVIIMNISRIIIGVHWPLDILAGTILWITSGTVFFRYFSQLKFVKMLDSFIIKTLGYIKL